ncbi:MAG: tetratricopeptide repeat protein [Kofleriaceae bacterium]
MTWDDLLAAVRKATRRKDRDRAEELVAFMKQELAHRDRDTPENHSAALFHEGIVADGFGDLDRAHACFTQAMELDVTMHGPDHEAVADVLHSLGLVEHSQGKLDAAATTFARAARIYAKVDSPRSCAEHVFAGEAMFKAGRLAEAEALLERALEASPTPERPWHRLAAATMHRVFIPSKRFRESMSVLAAASRAPLLDDPRWREAQARIWCDIGNTSIVFAALGQAAAAYECVIALGEDARLLGEARQGLAHAGSFGLPLDVFRVVYVHEREPIAHVMHRERGLYVVSAAPENIDVGDAVEIEENGRPITSIIRVLRGH